MEKNNLAAERRTFSLAKLSTLKSTIESLDDVRNVPGITVFTAGSYGRLEASDHSDVDMFFITSEKLNSIPERNTLSLKMFGNIIATVGSLGFPKFSNDCEFLKLISNDDMMVHLGSRADDHENYFTIRMLLLLESQCVYGTTGYDSAIAAIVDSYFRDYPDHQHTFLPTFLINDIHRYWLTLTVNYENKRNVSKEGDDAEKEKKKIKQKVKNFKLKYSRRMTCYATIAALGALGAPVKPENVIALAKQTPRERLLSVAHRFPDTQQDVTNILAPYDKFLALTSLTTTELEGQFEDRSKRTKLFAEADEFGGLLYSLLAKLDKINPDARLLRTLVL